MKVEKEREKKHLGRRISSSNLGSKPTLIGLTTSTTKLTNYLYDKRKLDEEWQLHRIKKNPENREPGKTQVTQEGVFTGPDICLSENWRIRRSLFGSTQTQNVRCSDRVRTELILMLNSRLICMCLFFVRVDTSSWWNFTFSFCVWIYMSGTGNSPSQTKILQQWQKV